MQHSESNTRNDTLTLAGQGRRTFIGAAAAALFAGVVIQITGCSTDDKEEPKGGDATGSVSDNHADPHKAVITKAQLDAGGGLTLDIKGSSAHSHTITLTASQVATIKAGGHEMTSSTTFAPPGGTGHVHVVMFN